MAAILITGASSGIGRALVLQLIKEGHSVWGIARNEEKLRKLATDLQTERFFYSTCDVASIADIQKLKEQMNAQGFHPPILMLNAGVTSDMPSINRQINFEGVVNIWEAFKPGIQKNGGTVAVSGSLFALVPAPFNISYSQSKLDALNFLKGLSEKDENRKISFNYFVLGPVNTRPGIKVPFIKSLFIPSSGKTALFITKHLGSGSIINIFPLSSKVMILLNSLLPVAVMNRLMTLLKR